MGANHGGGVHPFWRKSRLGKPGAKIHEQCTKKKGFVCGGEDCRARREAADVKEIMTSDGKILEVRVGECW